jgi:hypothetical protein
VPADRTGIAPLVVGEFTLPDGRLAVPALHLVVERYLDPQYAPAAVAERCGVPADTIRRLAQELAQAAFDSDLRLPIRWTDVHGIEHAEMVGRPVAMHAMRGISAHSNGFHTCRALHLLPTALARAAAPMARSMPARWALSTARKICWWTKTASRAASTMRFRGPTRWPRTA